MVLIQRNNRWVRFKVHPTERAAKAHAAALNVNVTAKEKPGRKRKGK